MFWNLIACSCSGICNVKWTKCCNTTVNVYLLATTSWDHLHINSVIDE